jgi:hypothetical protein
MNSTTAFVEFAIYWYRKSKSQRYYTMCLNVINVTIHEKDVTRQIFLKCKVNLAIKYTQLNVK